MRLVAAEPLRRYTNIQHATFECDCGHTSDAMMADKD
jgi:hypothetical protein